VDMRPIPTRIAQWLVLLAVTGALLLGGCAQPTGPAWTYVPPTPTPSGAPTPSGSANPPGSAIPSASEVVPASGAPTSSPGTPAPAPS